jgi:hypothetical protein
MYPASRLERDVRALGRPTVLAWRPSRRLVLGSSAVSLASALVLAGSRWPAAAGAGPGTFLDGGSAAVTAAPGLAVVVQLAAAALMGMLVTAVQREVQSDRALNRSMEQAQTLLCVSGALMMIIIGNSLARAFGIAGAAAIIRFRTPVDDPRDTTILFILLALGMAAGIGALAVAGVGTLALCVLLPVLDGFSGRAARTASLECTAVAADFPLEQIQQVFARHGVAAETREVTRGDQARMKFAVTLAPAVRIEELTTALVEDAGLQSVAWDIRKKG